MKEYKKKQIIKHALQYYIKRQDADEKDIRQEQALLDSIVEDVEEMKERYGIEK